MLKNFKNKIKIEGLTICNFDPWGSLMYIWMKDFYEFKRTHVNLKDSKELTKNQYNPV